MEGRCAVAGTGLVNTFVERHRDDSWYAWTAADGENNVVSCHATHEQAEQGARVHPW
jgi:hypothetical protein